MLLWQHTQSSWKDRDQTSGPTKNMHRRWALRKTQITTYFRWSNLQIRKSYSEYNGVLFGYWCSCYLLFVTIRFDIVSVIPKAKVRKPSSILCNKFLVSPLLKFDFSWCYDNEERLCVFRIRMKCYTIIRSIISLSIQSYKSAGVLVYARKPKEIVDQRNSFRRLLYADCLHGS